jgi:hypothetical protein
MKEYPRTLEAVERAEMGVWPVVDALLAEVEMASSGTTVKRGEYERVAKFLADNGFPDYKPDRLKSYGLVGRWAESGGDTTFRSYPFSVVAEAKKAAKGDHEQAILLLKAAEQKRGGSPTFRDIRVPEAPMIPQTEEEADKVVDAMIAKAPMRVRVHMEDELRLARAGVKRLTPVQRKEAEAATAELTDRIQRGFDAGLGAIGVATALERVAAELAGFTAGVPAEALQKIKDAYERVGQELEILEAREGAALK